MELPFFPTVRPVDRRRFLSRASAGVGGMALSSLLDADQSPTVAAAESATAAAMHFAPRADAVIHIHLVGAPSQIDLFDPKPELTRRHGQRCPDELFAGKKFAFLRDHPTLFGTPKDWGFRSCGDSGMQISNLMPHLQEVADELCMVRSLHTDEFNHGPAQLFMMSGFGRFGRPSLGSWVTYGLGSENADLPAYIVMITGNVLGAGNSAWGSGFLPTVYQGVEFRSGGDPVLFLSNPPGVDPALRRRIVDSINDVNRSTLAGSFDPELETRIDQYELAFRMQTAVPELMDLSTESQSTHDDYGTTRRTGGDSADGPRAQFANHCLLARRLVERGVRFVQLFDESWDHHGSIASNLPKKCRDVDQPVAALIRDLKRRGMLDRTLVVWSAEFGRTPMAQTVAGNGKEQRTGRDHQRDAFTMWMAGGGTRGGTIFGETSPLGASIADDPVHVHDWNATLLHILGLDHTRLTYRHQGRQYRLTDVHGDVQFNWLA